MAAFAAAPSVGAAVIAAPPGEEKQAESVAGEVAGDLELIVVPGGEHRSLSVASAVERVETDTVLVHDAARPLVTAELIEALLEDLGGEGDPEAVVAATPVTDTIKEAIHATEVDATLDRSSLWAAQTPQAFKTEALRRALASTELLAQATDDAMLLERLGGKVRLHDASPENIKVTTPLDLRIAGLLLAARG